MVIMAMNFKKGEKIMSKNNYLNSKILTVGIRYAISFTENNY